MKMGLKVRPSLYEQAIVYLIRGISVGTKENQRLCLGQKINPVWVQRAARRKKRFSDVGMKVPFAV